MAPGDSTGVTTFLSEACESVEVLGKHYAGSKLVSAQPDFQDLKNYFSRPRMIGNGVLPTASRANIFLSSITTDTIFSGYFLNGYSRLAGVDGARFKLVYTLQVAATPYHQGILALNWQYATAGNATSRAITSQSCTALPHVRLDLAVDTMVQLSVPFLFTGEYLDFSHNPIDNYGIIALNAIAAIPTVASIAAPSYKLYVHIEDLELVGASGQAAVTFALQAGKKLPVDAEREDDAFPMSSALAAASRSFSWIAKGIPSLASLAGPPAWFLGKASGVIRYFGYSKPQVQDSIMRMQQMATICEQNVDVPSPTLVVGAMASNNLAMDGNFSGTNVDEMAFDYVLGQYSQICYGAISTSNTASQIVYGGYASPSAYWFRANLTAPYCNPTAPVIAQNGTTNCFYPSNLFWVGSCFRQWKGSVRYRFTFSKTKYHGGRVMAAFVPTKLLTGDVASDAYGNGLGPEALGGNTQPFGYTAVFDLRDSNVFEFDVSYVNSRPYTSFFENIGTVSLSIIDPLQAPTTVSSTINFIVEVKALPGFEFATPIGPRYPPIACQSASAVRLQAGKMLSTINDDVSQYCVGERLNSIKQLIMMPKWSNGGAIGAGSVIRNTLFPWFYSVPQALGVPAPTTPWGFESLGWGGYFAKGYSFVRGSTDYHYYGTTTQPGTFTASISLNRNGFGAVPSLLWTPNNGPTTSMPRVFCPDLTKGFHVRVPFYSRSVRVRADQLDSVIWYPAIGSPVAVGVNEENPITIPTVILSNSSVAGSSASISRSAGDDAMLGQFIGPPFLGLLSGGSGSTYDLDSTYFQ